MSGTPMLRGGARCIMRSWTWIGIALAVVGAALALVPRYLARPSAEPGFVGTYVWVGLPLALVGFGLILWDARRSRAGA